MGDTRLEPSDSAKLKSPRESESDGFFSALGDVFSEYWGVASFFSMFMLIAAVGLGYLIRSSRIDEPKVLISSTMDAELIED